jgi:2-oxoisovalerate dehydrogenase E1 component alpha subunit
MNFAAVHKLPVVFVCENNRYAISTPQRKQMANADVAARARGYGMPGVIVDGFDPLAVYATVHAARERAAAGDGPTLVEAKCYRFLSHTTDDDDRTYRTREEVDAARAADPVPRFERRLVEAGLLTDAQLTTLREEITELVNTTTDRIEAEELPSATELHDNVVAGEASAWL